MSTPFIQRPLNGAAKPSASPHAVLIDGSALYFAGASRGGEGRRLNYQALIDVLVREIPGLVPAGDPSRSIWSMWTSADPANAGQTKFLDFAEQRLRWAVRPSFPSQAFMVEPEALFGISADNAKLGRLLRFDAPIAFAMGRLAETHRLVVVSDSYALRDSMARITEHWENVHGRCVHAFFGRACDMRWHAAKLLPIDPQFIDLDQFQTELFGHENKEEVHRPIAPPGQPFF